MKYGLEVEFFATKNHKIVNIRDFNLPSDEYPLLAEARGTANNSIFQAVASVRGEIDRISSEMSKHGVVPLFTNWLKRDKEVQKLHEEILRTGLNKQIAWRNLDGKEVSKKNEDFIAAGLHVSFTNESVFEYKTKGVDKKFTYYLPFDYAYLFRKIEKEFGAEIKKSERVAGFYEVKPDGRVEYRSLPATLIWDKNFAARLAKCL